MRNRMMLGVLALQMCAAAIGGTLGGGLGPSPYSQFADSPFAATSFAYFHLEDFEDGLLNTPGLTASAGAVNGPGPFTDSVDFDDGVLDGDGTRGHSYYLGVPSVTFTFDAAVLGALPTHVGLVWTDVGVTTGTYGVTGTTVEFFNGAGVLIGTIGPATLGDGQITGGTAEDRFFGWVDLGGIGSVRISQSDSSDWEVDHVQYGLVPAPGSVALFGLCGLLAARRRR